MTAAHSTRPPHRGVASSRLKTGVFALTGANSMATTYFFYYIYFYTQDKFGFGQLQNFGLAALLGAVYAMFAFMAGRFAQRAGYFASLQLGLGVMIAAILLCSRMTALWPALALIVAATIGMCFTWPSLEGLMSEGETRARLRGLVGIYNFTWAVTGALAYFTGGAMQKSWGRQSMFFVPAGLLFLEMIFSFWLEKQVNRQPPAARDDPAPSPRLPPNARASPVSAPHFSENGLAGQSAGLSGHQYYYCQPFPPWPAISISVRRGRAWSAPSGFSPARGPLSCSGFGRGGTTGFVSWPALLRVMILCFGAMLLAPALWILVLSQVVLGLALGLIYYSSLFYSMDVGETKGEHGGIHESAIGAGNCAGPAIAAAALLLFPAHPSSGTLAVCLLLLCGLGGLFWLRYHSEHEGLTSRRRRRLNR